MSKKVELDIPGKAAKPSLFGDWNITSQLQHRRLGVIDLRQTELVPYKTSYQTGPGPYDQMFGPTTNGYNLFEQLGNEQVPVLGDVVLDAWLEDPTLVPDWVEQFQLIPFWGTAYDYLDNEDGIYRWYVRAYVPGRVDFRKGTDRQLHNDDTISKHYCATPVVKGSF